MKTLQGVGNFYPEVTCGYTAFVWVENGKVLWVDPEAPKIDASLTDVNQEHKIHPHHHAGGTIAIVLIVVAAMCIALLAAGTCLSFFEYMDHMK